MRLTARAIGILVILVLLPAAACDPVGPGAQGRLAVSSEAVIPAGGTLEVRAFPDDGKPFHPASLKPNGDWLLVGSWRLSEVKFPFAYMVGGKLGYSESRQWRLLAWIAGPEADDRPVRGTWYGTRIFSVDDCPMPFSGYCGTTPNADFEIDRQI